jgi:GT2 family glycosyltransferase
MKDTNNLRSDNDINEFRQSDTPLISCIILLTLNDLFVKKQLIPSIISNSRNHDIEIIIVYNGFDCNLSEFGNIKVITSELLWVAKAYNNGVKNAKGKYIALFHDDCVLRDKRWIEKSITMLNDETIAVSPEFDGKTAKCVPLIMRKSHFENLGGFDEHYFLGIEDADFTLNIKDNRKKVKKCNIDIVHYKGISTILLLTKDNTLKNIFGNCSISKEKVWSLRQYYLTSAYRKGLAKVIFKDKLYLIRKYKDFIFNNKDEFLKEERKLKIRLSRSTEIPNINSRNKNILKTLEKLKSLPALPWPP